jgi:hypothetical protein
MIDRPTRGSVIVSNYLSTYTPILHALNVWSILFFGIYLFFLVSHPLLQCSVPSEPLQSSPYQPFPNFSVCQSLNRLPAALISKPTLFSHGIYSAHRKHTHFLFSLILLLSGDVSLNPGPVATSPSSYKTETSCSLNLTLLNIRSAASITSELNKPAAIHELISDHSIDILALTETWLSSDTPSSVLNSLTPPNYSIMHSPRLNSKGGGLALIYRSYLKISKLFIPTFSSFEAMCVQITISSFSCTLLTIYRPPSLAKSQFISDFSSLLEHLVPASAELMITGDFNFHVDNPTCPTVSPFLTLLDTFNLSQLVNFPTHVGGHSLDLLISKSSSKLISDIDYTIPALSDHYAVLSVLNVPTHTRSPRITKFVRSISKIDPILFSNDILASTLYSSPSATLDSYLCQFNSTLSTLLDKHAPLKSISFQSKIRKPFITDEIVKAKSIRSKLETIWRKQKSDENKKKFKTQAKIVNKLITKSRRNYYRELISNCANQPKKLWSAIDALLSRTTPPVLPSCNSPSLLACSFLKFFSDKISILCSKFPNTPLSDEFLHPTPSQPPKIITEFIPANPEEIRAAILASSNATCSLDVIPTRLLKSCLESLIIPITNIINLSLSEGTFHPLFKSALVTPLLKKHSLPADDLSSYRPISNLNFISKILERIIHSRLSDHLHKFPSLSPFQSAYRKFHSTETALLRIQNDLLLATNKQKISALVLLDLSAAFDTIDHKILLDRLSRTFGITDNALSLLSSFLINRFQSVSLDSNLSNPSPLDTGVPQGSVLGPLLFSLYTSPLSLLLKNTPVSFHLYADDTQLYISFSSSDSTSNLAILSSTLDSVHAWLTANRLSVNPSKTEYLLVGTNQQRSKLISSSLLFQGNILTPSSTVQNLGVTFDADLSYHHHISKICSTSFYHIRHLRQIRSSIDQNSAIILANALVSSRLDYCNSLFYGLPSNTLYRLQKIQNSVARVVVPSVKRYQHITPTLRTLHWLPVEKRITYKIATLTFKTQQTQLPSYLSDLLTPYKPSRHLRSASQHLLVVPNIKTAAGRRSFSYAAPTIWNSLPIHIRSSPTITSFRSALKTYLFPP